MVDTPTNTGPANYDGDQVISMNPTAVYETTFYRKSTDVTLHIGGDDGLNYSLNGVYPDPWTGKDPDGTHQGLPGFIDITTSNPFPDSIYVAGTTADGFSYGTVPSMLNVVSGAFQTIYNIWDGLSLSWIGQSADAAQELQDQLDKIQNRIFGAKIDDKDQAGVLEQMSSSASYAASIYSNVEETNTKMFNDFADNIPWSPLPDEDPDPGPTQPEAPAPDAKDVTLGPITEKY
jgi:hypothetical protein